MESKHKLSINQWALEDRHREKMMEKGAAALSEYGRKCCRTDEAFASLL